MSSDSSDFRQLMKQVDGGSNEAAQELLKRYGRYVLRAIRAHLHRDMRTEFDSEDFRQMVWKSFFANEPHEFEHEGELIAFLSKVATNKVAERFRYLFQTQKRAKNREQPIELLNGAGELPVPARDPTPSQILSAEEQLDRLSNGQPLHRQMLEMKASGSTLDEIAKATSTNEKTVRRVIKRMSSRVES